MPAVKFATKEGWGRSALMPVPKKVYSLEAWFKAARMAVPEIPDPKKTDWSIVNSFASVTTVSFEMHNTVGERATVLIDRTVRQI